MRCSYKLTGYSLSDLANFIGGEKKIFPYHVVTDENLQRNKLTLTINHFNNQNDFEKFSEKNTLLITNLQKLVIQYCISDVLLLKKIMERVYPILDKFESNLKSYSGGGLAVKFFFNKCNSKKIEEKINNKLDLYVRNSFFGGRCEVYGNPDYRSQSRSIQHYDFPSMYGTCMLEKYPVGNFSYVIKPKNFYLPGFYKIKYRENSFLPVLPIKYNKLMFMNGLKIGTY